MSFNPLSARNALNSSDLLKSNPPLYNTLSAIIDALVAELPSKSFDSGSGYTNSGDANGTRINFTKPFNSVIVTPVVRGAKGFCSIFDKQNSYFTIKAYDDTGARISVVIDWIAIGVLQ